MIWKMKMRQDKENLAMDLEERINQLVRQWRNSSPNDRSSYDERIKKLCTEYFALTSKKYKWENGINSIYTRKEIREVNDKFAI